MLETVHNHIIEEMKLNTRTDSILRAYLDCSQFHDPRD